MVGLSEGSEVGVIHEYGARGSVMGLYLIGRRWNPWVHACLLGVKLEK